MAIMALFSHRVFGSCFRKNNSRLDGEHVLRAWFLTVLAAGLMAVCSCRLAQAQTAGTITGTVTDESGALVPNATVTITNVGTGVVARTITTGSTGIYVAEALPVGLYQVSVSASGFQPITSSNITLNVADRLGR